MIFCVFEFFFPRTITIFGQLSFLRNDVTNRKARLVNMFQNGGGGGGGGGRVFFFFFWGGGSRY